jgi:hypothetical protein
MPYPIKNTGTVQTLPNVRVANYGAIGVNQGGYGLTSSTAFWNGKTPNVGGYVTYSGNGTSSPTMYISTGDTQLIALANQLGGSSITTIGGAINYLNFGGGNYVCVNMDCPNIVTSGLTLYLDAGYTVSYPKSSNSWIDISGNGNNGSLINGPTYSSDGGGCIVFDGNDDYVLSSNPSLSGSPFTLAIWVKPIVTPVDKTFLSIGSVATNYNTIYLQFVSDTTVKYNTPSDFLSGTIPSVTGNWNYIVVTMTISKTLSIYCNGSLINSSVMGGLYSGNTTVTVGAYNVGAIVQQINASIANVQIYNRVLSVSEILQNYYAGLQRLIPTDNLVLWLDGTNTNTRVITPTTAYDISGNNYNGSFVNGTTLAHRDGGTVFNFDGVDDKLTTTLSTLTSSSSWTIWVKRTQSMNFFNMFMSMGSTFFAYRLDGVIQFSNLVGGNQQDVLASPSLTDDVWYSFAFTSSYSAGNTTMGVYVNGVLQTQSTFAGQQSITSPLIFGDWAFASYPFKGKIGDVRVYSRALTATEISTIYTAGRTRYGL